MIHNTCIYMIRTYFHKLIFLPICKLYLIAFKSKTENERERKVEIVSMLQLYIIFCLSCLSSLYYALTKVGGLLILKNRTSLQTNLISLFFFFILVFSFLKLKYPPHWCVDCFWWTWSHVSRDRAVPGVQRAFPGCVRGVRGHHSISEWSRWFQFYPESGIPYSLSW